MAMTEARRALLLAYCKESWDELSAEDRLLLESMYDGAVSYMEDSGVREPDPDVNASRYGKYVLCTNALTLDAWDNRGTQFAGYTVTENRAFRLILNQLKRTEPVSNSGTGGGTSGGDTG